MRDVWKLGYHEAVGLRGITVFHSLYDHAVMASRRGCRRSSLELMKLLYQVDARDPMGVLLGTWRWCRHKMGTVVFTGLVVSLFFFPFLRSVI